MNKLIYGKDETQGIISLEVKDSILYKYLNDGTVLTEPYKYWLITDNNYSSSKSIRLQGDQAYKWLVEFETEEEWSNVKSILYKKRKDFYCVNNIKEQAMLKNGITYFKGLKPNDVSVLSFDIETDGLKKTNKSEVYIISNTFRNGNEVTKKLFRLDEYSSQKEMLESWCKWVRQVDPAILLGHNIYMYDIPY